MVRKAIHRKTNIEKNTYILKETDNFMSYHTENYTHLHALFCLILNVRVEQICIWNIIKANEKYLNYIGSGNRPGIQQLYLPSIKIHFQDSAIFLAKVDLPTPWHKGRHKIDMESLGHITGKVLEKKSVWMCHGSIVGSDGFYTITQPCLLLPKHYGLGFVTKTTCMKF